MRHIDKCTIVNPSVSAQTVSGNQCLYKGMYIIARKGVSIGNHSYISLILLYRLQRQWIKMLENQPNYEKKMD